ncbi:MAG: transposase [Bacteroidetes bacterium]|nr:transposase [Bacteroidota bacterium]
MRSSYKILDNQYPYFITSTILEWIPIFTNSKYCDILTSALKFYQTNKNLKIFSFVTMDNHFHLIAVNENLSRIMSNFKKYTAKQIINNIKKDSKDWLLHQFEFYKKAHKTESEYQVWQEGFHPIQISSQEMFNQKAEYIHYNPVRRGLVENPEDWKYSSASHYLKDKQCVIDIDSF